MLLKSAKLWFDSRGAVPVTCVQLTPVRVRVLARSWPEVVAAPDKDALSGPVGARRSVQHFVTPDAGIVRAAAPVLDATPAHAAAHLISAVTRPLLSSSRRRPRAAAEPIGRFLALSDVLGCGPRRHLAALSAPALCSPELTCTLSSLIIAWLVHFRRTIGY